VTSHFLFLSCKLQTIPNPIFKTLSTPASIAFPLVPSG
jgi:hypothetical protein